MTILAGKLPKITKELVDELDRIFKTIAVSPDTDYKQILFNAGQRSVIDWLRSRQEQSILTGNPDALNRA